MGIDEYMRSHTERQHAAWVAWLEERWNRKDKVEWYLQQIAVEVRRTHRDRVAFSDLDLQFTGQEEDCGFRITPELEEKVHMVRMLGAEKYRELALERDRAGTDADQADGRRD
jgi:hypothetical protein